MSSHSSLTGLDLHQPFHYVQESDPGAVGAGLTWFKKSTKTLSYRNDADTAWLSILTSSNENALPSGTTWTEFLAAYASTDPGDTITLPNDTLNQEANFHIDKSITIRAGGPASNLYLPELVTSPSKQLWTGFTTDTTQVIRLDGFTMEHAAGIEGSGFGDIAIGIFNGSYNVHVNNITFRNITSDCVTILCEGWIQSNPLLQAVENVYVTNCTADEWYESFFNIHETAYSVKNIYVRGNTGTTSAGNPNGAVSRPYAIYISTEETVAGGLIENLHIAKNTLINAMPNNVNTVGIRFKRTESPLIRYHRCYVTNNWIQNWYQPFGVAAMNESACAFPGDAFIYVYGNTFYGGGNISTPIANLTPAGPVTSTVYFGDNDIFKGASTTAINNSPFAPATVVIDPPNRVTDF